MISHHQPPPCPPPGPPPLPGLPPPCPLILVSNLIALWLRSSGFTYAGLFIASPPLMCDHRLPVMTGSGQAMSRSIVFQKKILEKTQVTAE